MRKSISSHRIAADGLTHRFGVSVPHLVEAICLRDALAAQRMVGLLVRPGGAGGEAGGRGQGEEERGKGRKGGRMFKGDKK
jgi:hypothetical protein